MKHLLAIVLFASVTIANAQRGGMSRGMGGGGFRGGMGGGGFRGGVSAGGFHGGVSAGGFRGGFGGIAPGHFGGGFFNSGRRIGFVGPSIRGFGFRSGIGFGWGGWGLGWGLGLGWGGYGCPYSYPCSSYVTYPYVGGYWPGYSDVAPAYYGSSYSSPPVTVVYPPATVERANPVIREYDSSGQEVRPQTTPNASPIYLFAFKDQAIRAASAYWVDGQTLHYVTLQHEEKQAPLDTLDRAMTLQLNRERRVNVQLP